MGTHVAAALTVAPCSHVVYVSSDAVYEDDVPNPIRETCCCSPSDLYGLMHLVRERMLAYALNQPKTPLAILRPCAIYGVNDTHNSYGPNRFIQSVKRGKPIVLFGQGEERRDHVFVEDVARVITLSLQWQSAGLLNVATGTAVSFWDVAQIIRNLSQGPVEIDHQHQPRAAAITHRHFDVSALIKAFPFFRFTSLDVGLAQTFAAMTGLPEVTP